MRLDKGSDRQGRAVFSWHGLPTGLLSRGIPSGLSLWARWGLALVIVIGNLLTLHRSTAKQYLKELQERDLQ